MSLDIDHPLLLQGLSLAPNRDCLPRAPFRREPRAFEVSDVGAAKGLSAFALDSALDDVGRREIATAESQRHSASHSIDSKFLSKMFPIASCILLLHCLSIYLFSSDFRRKMSTSVLLPDKFEKTA